jgi:F420-dependent oxidoreductase-like protein
VKLGLQIPVFSWPGGPAEIASRLAEIGRSADELGFASLWVMDHFFQIEFMGGAEEPMLESYSALAFLAAHTRRVQLGALVSGVTYRHPALLVKTVTTLDVLSGGRGCLGIGAAWYEREHVGLGVPFPPIAERFERLEETLRIARQMGAGTVARFEGKHTVLAETLNQPPALARPQLPIWIGGLGERKTLRLVAEYADAWNALDFVGLDKLVTKRDVLRRHCDDVGRDFDEIECSTLGTLHLAPGEQSPKDVIRLLSSYARAGFSHAIVNLPNVHEIAPLELLAREVMPEIAEL